MASQLIRFVSIFFIVIFTSSAFALEHPTNLTLSIFNALFAKGPRDYLKICDTVFRDQKNQNVPDDQLDMRSRTLFALGDLKAKISLQAVDPSYSPFLFHGKYSDLTPEKKATWAARLEGIRADLISLHPGVFVASHEVRGPDVGLALAAMEDNADYWDQIANAHLAKSLPHARSSVVVPLAFISAALAAGIETEGLLSAAEFMMASGMAGISTVQQMFQQFRRVFGVGSDQDPVFRLHLQSVENAMLFNDTEFTAHFSSGGTTLTEYAESLRKGEMDNQTFAESCEGLRAHSCGPLDSLRFAMKQWKQAGGFWNSILEEKRRHPDGAMRDVEVDQFFYFDRDTHEPVLVSFLRIFKEKPSAPRKTDKSREGQREPMPWEQELVPIPLRGNRR